MLDSFEYLPDTLILSPLSCFSKKRLFEDVADLARKNRVSYRSVFEEALQRRKRSGEEE